MDELREAFQALFDVCVEQGLDCLAMDDARKALAGSVESPQRSEGEKQNGDTSGTPIPAQCESPPSRESVAAKRWWMLEHGCQFVSFQPINGGLRSFDPRNMTGYDGDLSSMRNFADAIALATPSAAP